jgi:hypothetical protein
MVVSRASSSTFKSAPITGNYLQNSRSASSRKLSGDFDPALRDGDWGGNSDPGFRSAPPWAIFVFSLRVCEFFVFLQNLLQKTNDLRAK